MHGEEVVSAAAFRRGGAAASMVASKAQLGGLVYAGIKLLNKKKAGGLPERVMLAVTPTSSTPASFGFKGRDYKIKRRGRRSGSARGLQVSTERRSGMTALTIESPAEGEKATLVGVGVKDDPISQELMPVLQGGRPPSSG